MIWTSYLIYDKTIPTDSIIHEFDQAVAELDSVSQEDVDLALVKVRSDLYDIIDRQSGVGRADLLASFALFDDDPSRINSLETEFKKITPDIVRKTAKEYLRQTNRTILILDAKASNL